MENTGYLEYLIPIIFFAIWIIGKIFARKEPQSVSNAEPSQDMEVYPYPEKEKFERVQEKTLVFQKDLRDLEQRKFREEKIQENFAHFPLKASENTENQQKKEQRSALLGIINDADSLRKAFILSEILNKPVALRADREKGF